MATAFSLVCPIGTGAWSIYICKSPRVAGLKRSLGTPSAEGFIAGVHFAARSIAVVAQSLAEMAFGIAAC